MNSALSYLFLGITAIAASLSGLYLLGAFDDEGSDFYGACGQCDFLCVTGGGEVKCDFECEDCDMGEE